MGDLKIEAGMALPGEAILAAVLTFAAKVREGMDPALRARLDAVTVQQVEDLQAVWRKIWIDAGIVKP